MPACKLFEDNPNLENHATITDMTVRFRAEKGGATLYISYIIAKYVNDAPGYGYGRTTIDWVSGEGPYGRYHNFPIDLPTTGGEEITGYYLDWMAPNIERWAVYEFKGEKTVDIQFTVEFMGKTTHYTRTVTMKSL